MVRDGFPVLTFARCIFITYDTFPSKFLFYIGSQSIFKLSSTSLPFFTNISLFFLNLPINIYLRYYHNDSAHVCVYLLINERDCAFESRFGAFRTIVCIIVRRSGFWARTRTHLLVCYPTVCVTSCRYHHRRERNGMDVYEQAGGRARAPAASGNGGPETPRSSLAVHLGRTDFNPATATATVAERPWRWRWR